LFSALDHPVRDRRGLGLGLGLCKALVEAHGGCIGAESGEAGVTLGFSLPLDSAAVEGLAASKKPSIP
jgi:signal transduction histidine kinase